MFYSELHAVTAFQQQQNMFIVNDNGGDVWHSTTDTPQPNAGRSNPQGYDIEAKYDVLLFLKSTLMSLSSMTLMFDIRNTSRAGKQKGFIVYSSLVLLLLGVSVWWSCTQLYTNLVATISFRIWTVQTVVHFVIFYSVSVRSNGMSCLLDIWQAYRIKYTVEAGLVQCKSNVCAGVMWTLICLFTIFEGYRYFADFIWVEIEIYSLGISTINWIAGVYFAFPWIASSSFILLMTNLFATEYQFIFKQIQQDSQMGSHLLDQGIGDIRRRHWNLSQVVSKADDIFLLT